MINPEAEVKKLQDLVKKLERQNEVLRSRQNLNENIENEKSPTNSKLNLSDNDVKKKKISAGNNSILEEVDTLDLGSSGDEEDSWLFTSPKRQSLDGRKQSPYKWVRQDFERPSPEVDSAKKTLINRLEEVAKATRSPYNSPGRTGSSLQNGTGGVPNIKQPLLDISKGQKGSFDTATFTRPKKNLDKNTESEYRTLDRPHVDKTEEHHYPDVKDIQELARLQEESLRQNSFSPLQSPRRNYRSKQNTVPPLSLSDVENSSPHSSNRSSPGRGDDPQRPRRLSNGPSQGSFSSGSSPPDSPYGSNQYLDTQQQEPLRRSLPNLSKGGNSNLKSPTEPRPQAQPQRPSSALKEPTRKMASPSVSGLRQPTPTKRPVSPAGRGIPQPKTGIPRPGATRSGIPSPRRIGIGAGAMSGSKNSLDSDESWKEGCY